LPEESFVIKGESFFSEKRVEFHKGVSPSEVFVGTEHPMYLPWDSWKYRHGDGVLEGLSSKVTKRGHVLVTSACIKRNARSCGPPVPPDESLINKTMSMHSTPVIGNKSYALQYFLG